jgi:hypothetical protein
MHQEALNNNTRALWEKCGFLDNCYLAGGTALAFQVGHRQSFDLDFFFNAPIKKTLIQTVEEKFGTAVVPSVKTVDELTVLISGVKVTFLHYPFPLLDKTVPTDIVPLASVRDIASMKAYTLGRRQSLKDYVDLYVILSKNLVLLRVIMKDAKQKYGAAFNDRLFLEQLLYTDDLEKEPINWLVESISEEKMEEFFENLVREEKGKLWLSN